MRFSAVSCRKVFVGLLAVCVLAVASPSLAERREGYAADEAGHPVKVVYYLLYPIGFVLDVLILSPAHWLGQHEPFRTLFGVDAAKYADQGYAVELPADGPPVPAPQN